MRSVARAKPTGTEGAQQKPDDEGINLSPAP